MDDDLPDLASAQTDEEFDAGLARWTAVRRRAILGALLIAFLVVGFRVWAMTTGEGPTVCAREEEHARAMYGDGTRPCEVTDDLGTQRYVWDGEDLVEYEAFGESHDCRWFARPFAERSPAMFGEGAIEELAEGLRESMGDIETVETEREALPDGSRVVDIEHRVDGKTIARARDTYDSRGRLVRSEDPGRGVVEIQVYDGDHLVERRVERDGATTRFERWRWDCSP